MNGNLEVLTGHKETMTSLEIAELVGREHKSVMRSIREMEEGWEKVCGCKFALTSRMVRQPNGGVREVPCYELTKRECLYIATKFNDEKRAKLILRWEELEKEKLTGGFAVPQTFSQALMLAAKQQEQIEQQKAALIQQGNEIIKLSNEIVSMKPKAEYYDKIMSSTDCIDITQIALDYGMSAQALNKKLHELRIQYKVNKQWILYSDYLQCGYVKSIPVDISRDRDWSKTANHTRWTRRGAIFIYEKLKTIGILPLMERQ